MLYHITSCIRCVEFQKSGYSGGMRTYWDMKIGTFWNIDYIGSRHAAIPKLGLSGPRTNINCF